MSESDYADAAKLLHDRTVAPELIDEWTAQIAAPKPASERGRAHALLLRAADEWLALPAALLEEALPVGPVHTVPYLSTPIFEGLTNVGGELLPCIRLARLLAGQAAEHAGAPAPSTPRLLAVNTSSGRFALLVDEVVGICPFDPDRMTPPPDTVRLGPDSMVAGMVVLEGRTAGLLDQAVLAQALIQALGGSTAP